jgi:CheY-like chemotaxis protein
MWKKRGEGGGDMEENRGSGILVVDDNQFILNMAILFFEGEGVEIHCASSGEEALRKIGERAYTMMITDFNMPGMDGLELARKVRAIAPHMPILMGTGSISPEIPRLAMEAGIDTVFTKPYNLAEMLVMVKRRIKA